VAVGVLGVAGIVVGALGLTSASSTRSDADDVAAEASATEAGADDAEATLSRAQEDLGQLTDATDGVAEAARGLETAIEEGVRSWNELDALFAQAIDLINAGDLPTAQAVLQQQEVFDAFAAAVAGETDATARLRTAVEDFEEVMSDA